MRGISMKKFMIGIISIFFILTLTGCSSFIVPETVTIDGVTYRKGFYEDVSPVFGSVGDIGSNTLDKEIAHEEGGREFRRVNYKGHNWVHSYTGGRTSGILYCEESQWEQEHTYYSDNSNYSYYLIIDKKDWKDEKILITNIDYDKFDELLDFGKKNHYEAFGLNEDIVTRNLPYPDMEESPPLSFYRVSNDGYFRSSGYTYHIIDDKLYYAYQYNYGHGEYKELLAVDVPEELGQYFIDLVKSYK